MAQQTAVDWLAQQVNSDCLNSTFIRPELIEQAKQMEKQQMKDAVIYGLDEDGHTGDWKIGVAENYYKKTYSND
jgi:hypothetical protein